MPFKSQAQRRKFAELLVRGEISPETFEEWNRETGSAKLAGAGEAEDEGKVGAKASEEEQGERARAEESQAAMNQQSPKAQLDGFLASYTPEIATAARQALARTRRIVPGAIELSG
jgi:hypothetical protein